MNNRFRAWLRLRRWAPSFEYRAIRADGDYIETEWGGWALHSTRREAEEELEMHEMDLEERGGHVERRLCLPWLRVGGVVSEGDPNAS